MAVAIPLLLLMVAGIIDIGILFWEKQVLTNASREGARAGSRAKTNPSIGNAVADKTKSEVLTVVQTYLNNYNLRDASGAPISLTMGTNFIYDTSAPPNLSVELRNIEVKMMLLPNVDKLFGGTLDSTVNLNAKTTMTAEWTTPPS